MTKTKGAGVLPYRLMMIILYGRHKWIERGTGSVRIPIPRIATHMRTRANKIREYLYLLQDWGFLDKVKVNKYWFSVSPTMPQNMGYIVGPSNVGLNDQVIGPDHDLNNTEVIDV